MELKEFIAWIKSEGKMQELQNFADVLCEKQRENCANAYFNSDAEVELMSTQILEAEQPKVEEL